MSQIAYFQCSTEEDLDCSWIFASGYDPTGRTLEVNIRDRSTALVKATLTIGSGLTVTATTVKAYVAKASMAAWAKTEYSADLVDRTAGAFKRLVPTRFTYDDPGKLTGGAKGAAFTVVMASNQVIVTSVGGPGLQGLKGDKGDKGDTGVPGAGAPSSPDIVAISQQARLERALSNAGVPEEPSLILDFVRGVHFASKAATAAGILTLLAAIGGVSSFSRSTTATYWDSDGLLKTAAANVPRIDYDPVTRLCRGIQLENSSRTNFLTYSEQLDNAAWGKIGATVTANALTAPDGAVTADKVVPSVVNEAHYVTTPVVSFTSGTSYSQTAFAIPSGYRYLRLALPSTNFAASGRAATFDLNTGTVAAVDGGVTAVIFPIGGGNYRCGISAIANASGSAGASITINQTGTVAVESFAGDGTSGIGIWGAQIEAGEQPSSYIPTVASAVVRGIDILTIAVGSWLSNAGLTCLVECRYARTVPASTTGLLRFQDSAANNYMVIRQGDAISGIDLVTVAGGTGAIDSGSYASPLYTTMRLAFGVDAAGWSLAKDNVTTYSGGAAALPAGMDRLNLAIGFNGHVSKLLVYPQRLSQAKAQILSNQAAWS